MHEDQEPYQEIGRELMDVDHRISFDPRGGSHAAPAIGGSESDLLYASSNGGQTSANPRTLLTKLMRAGFSHQFPDRDGMDFAKEDADPRSGATQPGHLI